MVKYYKNRKVGLCMDNGSDNRNSFNNIYNSLNKSTIDNSGLFSYVSQIFLSEEDNMQSTSPMPIQNNQLDEVDKTFDEVDKLNQSVNTSFDNNQFSTNQPVTNNQVNSVEIPVQPVGNPSVVEPVVIPAPEVNVTPPTSIDVSNIEPIVYNNTFENMNNYNNMARIEELKQKSNNPVPVYYNDGLDEEDYTGITGFLANKKIMLVVALLAFVCVCVVVTKTFYFSKKVDHYEEVFIEITEKEETMAKAYESKEIDNHVLKKVAATELISCINAKVDTDNLPDSITSVMKEINNYFNQSYNYFAFKYKDIYTGFTVSYNENQNIFTASTIKAPADIYLYEMASLGKIDLDEELMYTGSYYNTGSGTLKTKPLNTKYSVRTLIDYSIIYSDNAAHNMLMDKYGRENMYAFWKELGTTAIFKYGGNWGLTNAHDATIYMEELYRFYLENDTYGEKLMSNFLNTTTKFILGKNGYDVANKIGWSGSTMHDAAIIFADNPYIVIGLSNLGDTNYYTSYFDKVNDLAYKLHTEYWKYKMAMCNEIKQY